MSWKLPMFPEVASTVAGDVDLVYFTYIALCGGVCLAVFATIIFFCVKYRKGSKVDRSNIPKSDLTLEIVWSVVPLFLFIIVFAWATKIYIRTQTPPDNAIEIYAIPKQWMWKFQHPNGRREIDRLHVPRGVPVKIILTSQDVIHSFWVPAFRVKQDALPQRYTTVSFTATQNGKFALYCTEYCGLNHAKMIGDVVVMEPSDYERWLDNTAEGEEGTATYVVGKKAVGGAVQAGGGSPISSAGGLAQQGERLFAQYGCTACHAQDANFPAPKMTNLYGHEVKIKGAKPVIADEAYIRESIINPGAKIVEGYDPVMPTFQGIASEEDIVKLIAYIKSLKGEAQK